MSVEITSRRVSGIYVHQDLCEGSALEAFFIDDVELQMLPELCEWAVARADRNWDRGQLVLIDEACARARRFHCRYSRKAALSRGRCVCMKKVSPAVPRHGGLPARSL